MSVDVCRICGGPGIIVCDKCQAKEKKRIEAEEGNQ